MTRQVTEGFGAWAVQLGRAQGIHVPAGHALRLALPGAARLRGLPLRAHLLAMAAKLTLGEAFRQAFGMICSFFLAHDTAQLAHGSDSGD